MASGVRHTMELFPQQSVLVTGASGFIGTRLAQQLIARHCRVTCLVRVHSRTDQLRSIGARLVIGDVTDRRSVERALTQAQADTVFHLAGLVKARRPEDFMRVNAGGVESVAAACSDRASPPNLVVVSSLSAAGPCAAGQVRVEGDSRHPLPATVAVNWPVRRPRHDMPALYPSPLCVRRLCSVQAIAPCSKCFGLLRDGAFMSSRP
jgi:nucleoside-diphosphate-sugar epimerase